MAERSLVNRKIEVSRRLIRHLEADRAPLLAAYWEFAPDKDRWILYLVPKSTELERELIATVSKIENTPPYRSVFSLSDVFVDARQLPKALAIGTYLESPDTDVIICPSPNPPTNKPTQPTLIDGATANPPNPTTPAVIPTSRLHRSFFDTDTPPRNAPQNFAIINNPLCESSIPHCFASTGRIGPSSAVPSPASISPKCISHKEGAAVLPRSTKPTPAANLRTSHYHGHRSSSVPRKPLFLLALPRSASRLPSKAHHRRNLRTRRRPSPSAARSSPSTAPTSRSTAKTSPASWKP